MFPNCTKIIRKRSRPQIFEILLSRVVAFNAAKALLTVEYRSIMLLFSIEVLSDSITFRQTSCIQFIGELEVSSGEVGIVDSPFETIEIDRGKCF